MEVRRKNRESSEQLLRRFNRSVQQSSLLSLVKKKRYFLRKPSKNVRRQEAKREQMIKEIRQKKREGY